MKTKTFVNVATIALFASIMFLMIFFAKRTEPKAVDVVQSPPGFTIMDIRRGLFVTSDGNVCEIVDGALRCTNLEKQQ